MATATKPLVNMAIKTPIWYSDLFSLCRKGSSWFLQYVHKCVSVVICKFGVFLFSGLCQNAFIRNENPNPGPSLTITPEHEGLVIFILGKRSLSHSYLFGSLKIARYLGQVSSNLYSVRYHHPSINSHPKIVIICL